MIVDTARVQCFFLESTDRVRQKLRRYAGESQWDAANKRSVYLDPCPANGGYYHNAEVLIEDAPAIYDTNPDRPGVVRNGVDNVHAYDGDPRWPTRCACGYEFTERDARQLFVETIYRRGDTGEETTLRDAPAGAMWYAPWMDSWSHPQFAHTLVVKLPDGSDWCVDGQASNCTRPGDKAHKCWVIEGATPPLLTVGKNGVTCDAGAGSIDSGRWHGFLRAGWLERC